MTRHPYPQHRQRGAALAVGLILLFVLTVLALTGMNTASTELIMAGNEQYRQNAFQAAETGIEQAMSVLDDLPQICDTETVVAATEVPGSETDTYTTTSRFVGETLIMNSGSKFPGLHYRVRSTGASARNASAVHEVGGYLVSGASDTLPSLTSCGGGIVPPTT